jgi:cyanophycin synthetase
MRILEQRILRGPNLWADVPCVMTLVDFGNLAKASSDAPAALLGRLLPATDRTKTVAEQVAHLACVLQRQVGVQVEFWTTAYVPSRDAYRIVVAFQFEKLGVRAVDLAVAIVTGTVNDEAFDERTAALQACAHGHAVGTSTAAVVNAARARGIPAFRITEEANLFQLGWGSRQKRLQATITGDTSHVAVGIASNKQLTKALLEQAGLLVPKGGVAATADDAVSLAERLRYPVTVKPLDGNQGKGVTTGCRDRAQVVAAFEFARKYGRNIIVERHIRGRDYRVLITGGRVAAASLRRPPMVCGDGVSTIRQLVDLENANPARGKGHAGILTRIPLDELTLKVLEEQSLTLDTVVPAGADVLLRGNANLSTGGTAEDVTDSIHPATREMCIRAADAIGLDIAGIDVICSDISQCLRAQSGALIEINAAPGIRMHEYPSAGQPRNAGDSIIAAMFGQGDGRIPVVAVTGTNGKTTTSLMIAHAARLANFGTGVTTTEGVYINGNRIVEGDCSGYHSARVLLNSTSVDFAVLETARGGILKRGLAFDQCSVGVVLNVSADHLGLDGIETVEQLAEVKKVVARTAGKAVVLNADDPHCVRMAQDLPKVVEVLFFSLDAANDLLRRHKEASGRAVYLEDGAIVIADEHSRYRLIDITAVPATMQGFAKHNIANALAAAAALIACGFTNEQIAAGLSSFESNIDNNPLRSNVYDISGVKVIIDYAHNAAAYTALLDMARSMSGGRLVGVITAPGDRRDLELTELGRTCAGGLDILVAYEADPRGRTTGDTAACIVGGALAAGMSPNSVHTVIPAIEAFNTALEMCVHGDLLVFACGSAATAKAAIAPYLRRIPTDPVLNSDT